MRLFSALALCLVAACGTAPPASDVTRVALPWPEMNRFTDTPNTAVLRPNAQIAQDFIDLAFRLENGVTLPILTRFEGPISVRVTGQTNETMLPDLQDLLGRLRREAGLDISLTNAATANITIEGVTKQRLQQIAPNAACFVVPRISSFSELRTARGTPRINWANLQQRDQAAIFVPIDVAPQEIRDCLHEELAQALGPLNDLYKLPDSVFNDDNIHAVLTGFDMLILRVFYAPEMRNGMNINEAADRIPEVLSRLNPAGQRPSGPLPSDTTRDWKQAIETALTPNRSKNRRRQSAERAIFIGQGLGWTGTREGFAHYVYGRLQIGNDSELARISFNTAARIYNRNPVTEIHAAHVAVQQLAFHLSSGDAEQTIKLADQVIPIAQNGQNAALLSLLMMFKAEALDLQNKSEEATALRIDALRWARYGFGNREDVLDRLNEIASLVPRG